jgi:hypothetical protein
VTPLTDAELDALEQLAIDAKAEWPLTTDTMSKFAGAALRMLADYRRLRAGGAANDGWRPIATCPVNQAVLIYLPNWEHYGPAVYRAILCDMGTGRRWHSTGWACGRDLGATEQPAAWRPLPPPPAEGRKEATHGD